MSKQKKLFVFGLFALLLLCTLALIPSHIGVFAYKAPPIYSRSYYMQDVSQAGMNKLGRDDAAWANKQFTACQPHVHATPSMNYMVIMDFGHINFQSGSYGAFNDLDNPTFASNSAIEMGTKAYLAGWEQVVEGSCIHLQLMLGVDNKFICNHATGPCDAGTAAAQWAGMIKNIDASPLPYVIVGGAIDAETSWSPGQPARDFVATFNRTKGAGVPRLVNFGDVEPYGSEWSNDDLFYIATNTDVIAEYYYNADITAWGNLMQQHPQGIAYTGVMTECSPPQGQPYFNTPPAQTGNGCIQRDHGGQTEISPNQAWNTFWQSMQNNNVNSAPFQYITNMQWQPPKA